MLKKRSNKIVGIKQCMKFLKNTCDTMDYKIFVAEDANAKLITPVIDLAKEKNYEINYVATMKELGQLCNIDVNAAVALLED